MPIAHPRKFSFFSVNLLLKSQLEFWFGLSLAFALYYCVLAIGQAFGSEYVVQDDAREYVFWMQRFLDPELLPNDLIADYFQSVTPPGYAALFRLMAGVGVTPLLLSKLLPVALCLVSTIYCFGFCLQLLPVPMAGFITTVLLNQSLWVKDDLASATPRAFVYPLLLAFLYYLSRRSLLPCLASLALLGLFYPPLVFVAAGVLCLSLLRWQGWRPQLDSNRSNVRFCVLGLGVVLLVLLPYALGSSRFGPMISLAKAKLMPEFAANGRIRFFSDNPWFFWLEGQHSGLRLTFTPALYAASFLLPILLRYPERFPLVRQLRPALVILPQLVLASVAIFLLAHATLFKLFLPSRYTQHSFKILMAVAAGIALTVLLHALLTWGSRRSEQNFNPKKILAFSLAGLLGMVLITYPSFLKKFPRTGYVTGHFPELYEFFAQQPKDSLIASLAEEADNLPTFAQRSILVGQEYVLPYHMGYYRQVRQRTADLLQAQYSSDWAVIRDLIQTYGVDFWLLDRAAFEPEYITRKRWLRQLQPETSEALSALKQGTPVLAQPLDRCEAFATEKWVVLRADCLLNALPVGKSSALAQSP
ncbi:hypothetical protein [Leptolyngbya sp. FACHB-261]|uniref:hypothetical protein n=1 Tax=Leptolyngbya sp. FACHB-261 TaxID=2692806 RepID=UPI00168507B6|nr:hypothetical protein [Leptolyngbya sp. FACHB-261]MBD2104797.1 hypothetical protein [Leptolyngbya sp. FACHB-261]